MPVPEAVKAAPPQPLGTPLGTPTVRSALETEVRKPQWTREPRSPRVARPVAAPILVPSSQRPCPPSTWGPPAEAVATAAAWLRGDGAAWEVAPGPGGPSPHLAVACSPESLEALTAGRTGVEEASWSLIELLQLQYAVLERKRAVAAAVKELVESAEYAE